MRTFAFGENSVAIRVAKCQDSSVRCENDLREARSVAVPKLEKRLTSNAGSVRLRQRARRQLRIRATTALPNLNFGFRAVTLALTANVQDLPLTHAALRLTGVALLYWFSSWVVCRTLKATAKWMRKKTDYAIRSKQHVSTMKTSFQSVVCAVYVPAAMYLPTLAMLKSVQLTQVFLGMCLDVLEKTTPVAPIADAAMDVTGEVTKTFLEVVLLELYAITQRVANTSSSIHQVAFVVFVVWFVQRWKEELVQVVVLMAKARSGQDEGNDLSQLVLPLSGLTSWAIAIGGLLMIVNVLGINVQPLLAVGGVGGVVLGWSAQSIFANALSGIKLFVAQPFVVGERIRLMSDTGAVLMSGYVESITPMYTTLRGDNLFMVHVPNKAVADMMVVNESRIAETVIEREFSDPRQWSTSLTLDYKDLSKLGLIVADINQFLARDESVNKELPFGANVGALERDGVVIHVLAHTTPSYANKFTLFQSRLTMDVAEILQKHKGSGVLSTQ